MVNDRPSSRCYCRRSNAQSERTATVVRAQPLGPLRRSTRAAAPRRAALEYQEAPQLPNAAGSAADAAHSRLVHSQMMPRSIRLALRPT